MSPEDRDGGRDESQVPSRSRKGLPPVLILVVALVVNNLACSYLSYDITTNTVERPPEETSNRDLIRVESSEVDGSILRLELARVNRIDQTVETRVEKTVDYDIEKGWVYSGVVNPVVDAVFMAIYFIPDSVAFLASSLVTLPVGAIAAIDSSDEKELEPVLNGVPLANAAVEISIRTLDLRRDAMTDDTGHVTVDLSDVGVYSEGGALSLRVFSKGDGLVGKSELPEEQLVLLSQSIPALAIIAEVEEPEPIVEVASQVTSESVDVRIDGDVDDVQIARTVRIASSATASDSLRRVALVVGNSKYRSLPPLVNPERDAGELARVLRSVGFEVILKQDQDLSEMKAGLREFAARLGPDAVGLFYYAGHAVQADGANYLIPLDADIQAYDEIEHETLDMARVLGKMEASQSPVKLVFVDACRNNPYPRFRSASRGLAVTPAPGGTLIAYATAPGDVASDGDGENSPFARHLISAIETPGLELRDVISRVQQGVFIETESRQRPWLSSDIFRPFYFHEPPVN